MSHIMEYITKYKIFHRNDNVVVDYRNLFMSHDYKNKRFKPKNHFKMTISFYNQKIELELFCNEYLNNESNVIYPHYEEVIYFKLLLRLIL